MSCLVDTFILSSRMRWMPIINNPSDIDMQMMVQAVPPKYRMMFRALLVRFNSLDIIMDNRDCDASNRIFQVADPYQTGDVKFWDRYRGDCLQQIIRKVFYDTLLIVENDYNPEKYNYFICLQSNLVISKSHWATCRSDDQAFIAKPVDVHVPSHDKVHLIHG